MATHYFSVPSVQSDFNISMIFSSKNIKQDDKQHLTETEKDIFLFAPSSCLKWLG